MPEMQKNDSVSKQQEFKDFEFRLEFEVEEDIEGELEDFVRLARLGLVEQAREHFQQTLSPHTKLFPVLAEYAELLVSESAYQALLKILPISREDCRFSDREWSLVTLLKALALAHTDWQLEEALQVARKWHIGHASREVQNLDEVEVQCLEIYLSIIIFLESQGVPLRSDDCQPSTSQRQNPRWLGFRKLIPPLLESGKNWEAHKIAKLLLDVYEPEEGRLLYKEFLVGPRQENEEESQIIARLSVTNAYLKRRLQEKSVPSLGELRELEDEARKDLARLFPNSVEKQGHYLEEYLRNLSHLGALEGSHVLDQTKQQQNPILSSKETAVTSLGLLSQEGKLEKRQSWRDDRDTQGHREGVQVTSEPLDAATSGVFSIEGSTPARPYVDELGRPNAPPSLFQEHRDGVQVDLERLEAEVMKEQRIEAEKAVMWPQPPVAQSQRAGSVEQEGISGVGYSFDLTHPDIQKGLRSILSSAKADIFILFGGLQNKRQLLFLSAEDPLNVPPNKQGSSTQGQEPAPADIGAIYGDDYERAENEIHAFGLYTNIVIVYAFIKLAEKRGPQILVIPAEDFVNLMRRQRDPQAPLIILPVKSSVYYLMLHRQGLPPMDKLLFAPDGTFLFTQDDFLGIDPDLIPAYLGDEKSDFNYSNGNYILLAIILELSMGKSLETALKELVFDELNMNHSTVHLQAFTEFSRKSRTVQGFQLSADGSRTEVNLENLLNDSTESGAMGLRSTLNDIAKLNLALLRRIGTEASFGLDTQNPFWLSFGGLVSLPAEGDFKLETPIIHLKAPDYEPTPLGKLSTKSTPFKWTQAVVRRLFTPWKRDTTEFITHKAGYINGHSCNIIVFTQHRDFLIIVSNSTGPSDIVYHVSRYLLQEILDLSPKIGPPGLNIRRETEAHSQVLASLEQSNLLRMHKVHNPGEKLIGTYRHRYCAQEIVIQADGVVIFQTSAGVKKSSPMRMAFERGNTNIIRLFINAECLPLQAWSVWADLTFHIISGSGRVGLSHEGGKDIYWKI